jgi:hypothetical protein
MTLIGYTMMCEQAGPKQLRARRRPRRGSRLRLRGDQRPLLPVAGLPSRLAIQVTASPELLRRRARAVRRRVLTHPAAKGRRIVARLWAGVAAAG